MSPPDLLHFEPLNQPRVWGGRQLETRLGRQLPDARPYGEAWDLVDREEHQSAVAAGPLAGLSLHELWMHRRTEIFGAAYNAHPATRFPLLIKVLDCADDLSLQVHPPAEVACLLDGEPKTELWYVAHASPGARMHAGLKKGVTRDSFHAAIEHGAVADCVYSMEPVSGDSLLVRSGRVHALGGGLLVYEIQQNSDTTYRVFDWNRAGLDGQPRELHVEKSMQCIDFGDTEPQLHHAGPGEELASCEHFIVSRRQTGRSAPHHRDRFRLIMPITAVQWGTASLMPGQLSLLPACATDGFPEPAGEWLEIELPPNP